jgi:hypothetical protein
MKIPALPALALLLSPAAAAQTSAAAPPDLTKQIQIDIQNPIKPGDAVPLADEPHYAHVFQNGYVQVFNLTVPPLDATLLHRHDHPYIYLSLGATEIVDAVEDQPPTNLSLADGATRYSPGGFADVLRTDAGIAYRNITVAFEHPQEAPQNLGLAGDDRPLGSCPQSNATTPQDNQIPFEQVIPCFETSEIHVDLVKVEGGKDYVQASPDTAALLIAMSNASLDVSLAGEHAAFLHAGDVQWLPAGVSRRVSDFLGIRSQFLLISFKDSGAPAAK